MADLSNKTALITGGASGLGKAITTRYLHANATVIICDINPSRIEEAIFQLSALETGTLRAYTVDITSLDAVHGLFTKIRDEFGPSAPDILVNNAGIMDRFDPVGDLDPGLWDRVMKVNLTAPFWLSKLAVEGWLAGEKEGCILNIASVAGKVGLAAGAAYTASKHGLIGLTKNTSSFYLNRKIRCNALIMGAMETNVSDAFHAGINQEGYQKMEALMKATGTALCNVDEVADLCAYIAGGRGAELVNGAVINVDRGWGSVMG
ncbi:SDR family NAD(P)-dependent oxidoreductase [Aspergillus ruber CBS 135680]|uniref:3-oxoacyl-[acyl-carrier-protein] reductase n=1 Tax=Aspergillus ruber (strain CBS 135680) TaxID=1388766 RepID=A0A017S349_ASPRC|nr:NAD(P)-binding protein [Aspergillus ruber CBS 135680]EYE90580.1 NAD(P)-binding protein [Aspergillus ruber CBS 135680]